MKINSTLSRWLLALGLILGSLPAAFGQATSTGTISGRVAEGATGRSLQGAIVKVVGSSAIDYTDPDGRYTLPGVPAGTVSVEIEYVGLDVQRQTVVVSTGATATLNVDLKSEVLRMQAFEVAEAARGQAQAMNQQKTAQGIINIVSEETFGAMNDGNIGYALQRLPGLTVNEGEDGAPEGANIRGMPSDMNSFQIDGNRIPTSGGSRGFNTRQLVSDGIATIEVIKAATPDRDGDAIGGTINVVSRSAFQRDGREIKLAASANYLGLAEKWGYNTRATYSDIYSLFGKNKNLGVSVSATKYQTNRYYTNNDNDYKILHASTNPTLNLPTETFIYPYAAMVQYNLRETNTWGLNATIDFRTGPTNSFYFKPLYSHYDIESSRYITRHYFDSRHQDALTGRKVFEYMTQNTGRGMDGQAGAQGSTRFIAEEADTHNDLYGASFGGKHQFESSTVTYDFFYSRSDYERDNDSSFTVYNSPRATTWTQYEYDFSQRLRPSVRIVNGVNPRDLSTAYLGELSIEPEAKVEEAMNGKVDYEKKFIGQRFTTAMKTGVKYRESKPRFEQTEYVYDTVAAGFPYASVIKPVDRLISGIQQYAEVEPRKVRALLGTDPRFFVNQHYDSLTGSAIEDYKAKESTTAAYVMGSLQSKRNTVITGLRMERNQWRSANKVIDEGTLSEKVVNTGNTYSVWLPGIHFRHVLAPNLILRESVHRSYARPRLSSLTEGRREDEDGNVDQGNPFLKPTTSTNFDAQLEYYTARSGLYSVGVFYKKMKGFYFDRVLRFGGAYDANGQPILVVNGPLTYTIADNANGAVNKGIELIAQQKLFFLPKPFSNLSVSLSSTFTDSDAKYPQRPDEKLPTFGFSDYIFTSSLEYVQGKFRGSVSYRYRSDYLSALGSTRDSDDIFAAREQVDAEVSYRFARKLRLFASGDNLTQRPQVSYFAYPINVEDNSQFGWRATCGVEYSF
ncbi:MAG: TonB-dependent receptor [Verrucomicrobiota bacterium]